MISVVRSQFAQGIFAQDVWSLKYLSVYFLGFEYNIPGGLLEHEVLELSEGW